MIALFVRFNSKVPVMSKSLPKTQNNPKMRKKRDQRLMTKHIFCREMRVKCGMPSTNKRIKMRLKMAKDYLKVKNI